MSLGSTPLRNTISCCLRCGVLRDRSYVILTNTLIQKEEVVREASLEEKIAMLEEIKAPLLAKKKALEEKLERVRLRGREAVEAEGRDGT